MAGKIVTIVAYIPESDCNALVRPENPTPYYDENACIENEVRMSTYLMLGLHRSGEHGHIVALEPQNITSVSVMDVDDMHESYP